MKLIVTENITLDGRIELLDDWFVPGAEDEDHLAAIMEFTQREDGLLLGRRTFEAMRGYWPHHTDHPIGAELDRITKFVVSSTLDDPGWDNSQIVRGDVLEVVRELKQRPGRDLVVTGSITLVHTLLEAGLVDEIRLFTYPFVQGRGRRLFTIRSARTEMTLLESRSFDSGVVLTRFQCDEVDPELKRHEVRSVLAGVTSTDLDRSVAWYRTLLDRDADARPMQGLADWYLGDAGT